ncbi:MAG: type II toxin-antitoxin system VapC family toxin [Candidatus Micrarchaeota archaeon]|nr:type II toxin-antitoxin system VapC family toxin [Candidatus Micrarchaeota archaeon]MDE1824171.1 type II toxin-antitoxin system VapC family toxin [Candidatus Micrarchaeota archaeon]MDE1849420.1 type II toxin-antitoxin system VapC family toxin [Candidatus Micrarchaeota archaeon]
MITLDASAAIKLVITEENSDKISNAFDSVTSRGEPILTVDIMLAESVNGLWKHLMVLKDIDENQFETAYKNLLALWNSTEIIPTEILIDKARQIAKRHMLTIYDSLYVSLSLLNNAPILSCDSAILEKSEKIGINTLKI